MNEFQLNYAEALWSKFYIKGEDGYVFLTSVGEEAVLTVMASKDVKLGLVFLDMRRAIPELAALI